MLTNDKITDKYNTLRIIENAGEQMNEVKAIYISDENDTDVIDLINRFASLQQLKPTTAIKRYLLRTLPQAIKNELDNNKLTNSEQESQEKNGTTAY